MTDYRTQMDCGIQAAYLLYKACGLDIQQAKIVLNSGIRLKNDELQTFFHAIEVGLEDIESMSKNIESSELPL